MRHALDDRRHGLEVILGITPQEHDLVFAVGAFVLFVAMLPAVWKRAVLPLSTCAVTGGVLFVFVLNYLTMRYWYAVVVEFGNVACWAFLAWLAVRARLQLRRCETQISPGAFFSSSTQYTPSEVVDTMARAELDRLGRPVSTYAEGGSVPPLTMAALREGLLNDPEISERDKAIMRETDDERRARLGPHLDGQVWRTDARGGKWVWP